MPKDWIPPGPFGVYTDEQMRAHRLAYEAARGDWWARMKAANKALGESLDSEGHTK
jgi:hypothetical protein